LASRPFLRIALLVLLREGKRLFQCIPRPAAQIGPELMAIGNNPPATAAIRLDLQPNANAWRKGASANKYRDARLKVDEYDDAIARAEYTELASAHQCHGATRLNSIPSACIDDGLDTTE
jgi:hypothetical protein